jgi:hypothetical protein
VSSRCLPCCVFFHSVLLFLFTGCGGAGPSSSNPPPAPARATISSLTPGSTTAGGAGFTLEIVGNNLTPGALWFRRPGPAYRATVQHSNPRSAPTADGLFLLPHQRT